MQESLDIYLAVPERHSDGSNCALTEEERTLPVRYMAEERPLPDENTGRDVKSIQLGRKNFQILVGTESCGGMATLPIARVRRRAPGSSFSTTASFRRCCR